MKLKTSKTPENGEVRYARHFFWIPTKINDVWVWLEWGLKLQKWNETLGWITTEYQTEK